MLTSELMVGDWVFAKNIPFKIDEIHEYGVSPIWDGMVVYDYTYELKDLEPIPITQEILEKNGFIEDLEEEERLRPFMRDDFKKFYKIPNCPYYSFYLEEWESGYKITDHVLITVKYVHELQHLLRLCNYCEIQEI